MSNVPPCHLFHLCHDFPPHADSPMPIIRDAILLAAGLGTRMGEAGRRLPKPLLPLNGIPLAEYALRRMEEAGARRIAVNIHHHADKMAEWLARRQSEAEVLISDERDCLLDTGGGLRQAMGMLRADADRGDGESRPCLAHNCDAFWQAAEDNTGPCADFARLSQAWDDERMDALLLLQNVGGGEKADFFMGADGMLQPPQDGRGLRYVGVQLVCERLFADAPANRAFPLQPCWKRAMERGRLFGLEAHDGGAWLHLGTEADLRQAQKCLPSAR